MKKWKKVVVLALTSLTATSMLTACKSSSQSQTINVVTREDGSGTRSAFIELFGIQEKQSDGKKIDKTTDKAMVTNSTAVMLTTIASNNNAIGYASLGSIDKNVKVLNVDGQEATIDNVKNSNYKISRSFYVIQKENVSAEVTDFMNFVLSKEGQAVVEKSGYIPIDGAKDYQASVKSGKIVISGSSSVTPIMEKLKEAYQKLQPQITIEIQQSDSSTGVSNAIDGTTDIGMASRELTDDEKDKGVFETSIAQDGIALIVNKSNTLTNISSSQVKKIFTGAETSWSKLD